VIKGVMSGSRPLDPERPILVWLAAWSAAVREDDDWLLGLKIAAFTLAWWERGRTPGRITHVLHPLDADSAEFADIRRNAVAVVWELVDPRLAALDADRVFLIERRCANRRYTFVDELLGQDEQVVAAAPVLSFGIRVSVLVLTDERVVIIFPPKFFVANARFAEIHLDDVLTVHYHAGSHIAAAMAGTASETPSVRHASSSSSRAPATTPSRSAVGSGLTKDLHGPTRSSVCGAHDRHREPRRPNRPRPRPHPAWLTSWRRWEGCTRTACSRTTSSRLRKSGSSPESTVPPSLRCRRRDRAGA
jgi:hypothetical protein